MLVNSLIFNGHVEHKIQSVLMQAEMCQGFLDISEDNGRHASITLKIYE